MNTTELKKSLQILIQEHDIRLGSVTRDLLRTLGFKQSEAKQIAKFSKQMINEKVIEFVNEGKSSNEIVSLLGISFKTLARKMKTNSLEKLVIRLPKNVVQQYLNSMDLEDDSTFADVWEDSVAQIAPLLTNFAYSESEEIGNSNTQEFVRPVHGLENLSSQISENTENEKTVDASLFASRIEKRIFTCEIWGENIENEANENLISISSDLSINLSIFQAFSEENFHDFFRYTKNESHSLRNHSRINKFDNLFAFVNEGYKYNGKDRLKYAILNQGGNDGISYDSYSSNGRISKSIDIDSVICVLNEISHILSESLLLFPFPNYENSLTTTNHIHVSINECEIKLSNIPNFEIAIFGEKNEKKLLIFFPHLIAKTNRQIFRNCLNSEELAIFYNRYLREALLYAGQVTHNLQFLNSIPFSYKLHSSACRKKNGTFSFRSVSVPKLLSQIVFQKLQEITKDTIFECFFVLYCKGMKVDIHQANDLKFWFDVAEKHPLQCYFDVALTCFSQEEAKSLYLKKEVMDSFINHHMNSVQSEEVNFLLESTRGMRSELKKRSQRTSHIAFYQMYSTEKIPVVGVQNRKLIQSFDFNDVINDTNGYKGLKERLRCVWPLMAHGCYGQRLELRLGFLALLHLKQRNFQQLYRIFDESHFIAIPSYHLSLFKLFMGSTLVSYMEELRKSSYVGVDEIRSINVSCALFKGLISSIEFSSWYKQVWQLLQVEEEYRKTGRFCFPECFFDEESLCFRFDQNVLKIDQLYNGPSRKTKRRKKNQKMPMSLLTFRPVSSINEVAVQIFNQYNEDVWSKILCWENILEREDCKKSFDGSSALTVSNLEKHGVRFKLVQTRVEWIKRIIQLFNFERRDLNQRGMQHWNCIQYLQMVDYYHSKMEKASFENVCQRIIELFKTNRTLVIPAFEPKGKIFNSCRLENGLLGIKLFKC